MESPIGKIFKKSPLLVKELSERLVNVSFLLNFPHKEIYLSRAKLIISIQNNNQVDVSKVACVNSTFHGHTEISQLS